MDYFNRNAKISNEISYKYSIVLENEDFTKLLKTSASTNASYISQGCIKMQSIRSSDSIMEEDFIWLIFNSSNLHFKPRSRSSFRFEMKRLTTLIELSPSDLDHFLLDLLIPIPLAQGGQLFPLELLLHALLADMEILTEFGLHLVFGLLLKLNQLAPAVLISYLVVFFWEDLSVVGVDFVFFWWVFELGLQLLDLGLLQLRNEIVRLHSEVLVVVPRIWLEPRIDGFLSFRLKDRSRLLLGSLMNANLQSFIFILLCWLLEVWFLDLSALFLGNSLSFGLIVFDLDWLCLFKDELIRNWLELLFDLS